MSRRRRRAAMTRARSVAMTVVVAVLWGVPFAGTEVALRAGAQPLFIAWARVAIGAVVLLAAVVPGGRLRVVRGRSGLLVALVGVLDIAAPFALVAVAQQHLSSSLAGILIATTPLFVGLIGGLVVRTDRIGSPGWVGLVLGFAGVVLIAGFDLAGDPWAGVLAIAAALGYALATLLVRRLDGLPASVVSAGSLGAAAILLTPFGLATRPTTLGPPGWVAIVLLGVLCTGLAVALYYRLVAEVGATRASLSLYLAPAVAVGVGVTALGESLTWSTVAGFGCVLAGSWLTDRHTTVIAESDASH